MQIKRSRALSCIFLYYVYSGLYFFIHIRDAAHPFLTKGMDCALVFLGIIICVVGFIKSDDSHEFLISDLKCFALCDMGSLFFQYLYVKEVPLYVMWTIIILKVFTGYSLIKNSLELMTESYHKCGIIKRWRQLEKKKFRLGVFLLISPAVLYYFYNMDSEKKYIYLIGYILFCYFYGLFILLPFLADPDSARSRVGDEDPTYDEKTVVYKKLDKYNPLSVLNRIFTGLLSIVFGKKVLSKIIVGILLVVAVVNVVKEHKPVKTDTQYDPVFFDGVIDDAAGNIIDEHGNVVGKLPRIAITDISVKTDFYREIFRENRISEYGKRDIILQFIGRDCKVISDKNTLIFYSKVVEGFGMCDLEGKVIIDPSGRYFMDFDSLRDSDICIFREEEFGKDACYAYNFDGKKISEKIHNEFGILRGVDCFVYGYIKETDNESAYYGRIVDFDGNVIADEITDCCELKSENNDVLLEIRDNEYYILSTSEGQRALREENGKYLSEDKEVNDRVFKLLKEEENDRVFGLLVQKHQKIESAEWVDEEHSLYHIAIKRDKEIENEYSHKVDYFISKDVMWDVSVDYPSKDSYRYDERHVYDNCEFTASYVDVNFDGHNDIIISLGYDENGDEICCAYLYEIDDYNYKDFKYVKSFEIIPNYSIDEEENVIKGYYKDGPKKGIEYTYQYQGDKFIKIAEERKSNG